MGKLVSRLGYFIAFLLLSPFLIFVGWYMAFWSLFGLFDEE